MTRADATAHSPTHDRVLFYGCFAALVTTAFGFIVRALLIDEWGVKFVLTETQKGEIFGVGLWPFAISSVLFSFIIDRIGYGRAMLFAFLCHAVSVVMTIFAKDYWSLYAATFIVALGNGTVESVVNPVVATMFSDQKTKWLNILHAAWPGGLVLGGLLALCLGNLDWRWKVGLLCVPMLVYAVLLFRRSFPVHERVAAGVSYRDMLRELGGFGAFIVLALVLMELARVFEWNQNTALFTAGGMATAFALAVGSLGHPIFVLLLALMVPLATTELGTDSWITPLMESEMTAFGLPAVVVLIYTSAIMMVLRLVAGPIVHKLSPLGLLATASAVAAGGLLFLSQATGIWILVAATVYGLGKTFFWPTMLGVAAERFPRGGALTINAMGGVGMLGAGVVGAVLLGNLQDTATAARLRNEEPALIQQVGITKRSVFGSYDAIDKEKLPQLAAPDQAKVATIAKAVQKPTLAIVAWIPLGMLVVYLGLIGYFRARGGYRAERI